jgi:hypothetical protein
MRGESECTENFDGSINDQFSSSSVVREFTLERKI